MRLGVAYWQSFPRLLVFQLRARWFPWPTDHVALGRTIFVRGGRISASSMRHELTHVRQYVTRGWWWVLTHPVQCEREAVDAQSAVYPTWRLDP